MKGLVFTGKRFRPVLLLAALVLLLSAVSAGRAEGQIRKLPIDLSGGAPYTATYRSNPEIYEDPSISVEYHHMLKGQRPDGRTYYYFYAIVTIVDPSQLRTAAGDPGNFVRERRMRAVDMAKRVNAVLAINGDFCTAFSGNKKDNYVLRQGTIYQDTVEPSLDMLLIDEDGDFHILTRDENLAEANLTEIDGKKIINAFQFGPALVIDGEPVDDEYILDPAHSPKWAEPQKRNPRMCIAQIDDLHYFVLATWHGINVAVLRDLVLSITPVKTLYVLDGGNSAQMVFLNSQVNLYESDNNKRTIYDIIYFASAYGD